MGNEIATVRISEFFIVMLQRDNSDGTKIQTNHIEIVFLFVFSCVYVFIITFATNLNLV